MSNDTTMYAPTDDASASATSGRDTAAASVSALNGPFRDVTE
jgi:hypothetical protein